MNTEKTPTPKHPGGRPPKDPADKVIKCHVSLTGAHHAATDGDRAGMIRRALDGEPYWKNRCKLAEAYIAVCPCDPDITKEQWEAYTAWQNFINPPSGDKQNEK